MEVIFDLLNIIAKGIGYMIAGFLALVVLVIVFGKKVESRFDLEAEFLDENNKEFAEFDIKSWRYAKEAGEYQLKASFKWNDERLSVGDKVSVYLNESLVLEGTVEKKSSIRLFAKHIQNAPENAQQGDECRVLLNGNLILKQVVIDD